MKPFFTLLAIAILTYILVAIARNLRLLRISTALVATSHPYTNTTGTVSILVLGDSTAVGVGVNQPEESVAGRLGRLLNASVENYAQSGAIVSELLQQMTYAKRDHYDLVLIQAGGNDIIKLRDLLESNNTMDTVLAAARKKSDRVALLTAGRIGHAPFFPKIVAPLLTLRSLSLRSLFMATAQKQNVLYVDLLGMSSTFNSEPGRYYAADMLHLTGAGYGVWFDKLESELRVRWPEMFTIRQ